MNIAVLEFGFYGIKARYAYKVNIRYLVGA